jgi:sarcosine oxidase subunit beta
VQAAFVIVGGGIYGVATAWHLASRGADVLVLEAGDIAAGASGGLGKRGVRANGRDVRELPLMRLAYDLWPSLHETLGAETGYERVGHLQLYERHHDVGGAAIRARVQTALGIPTTHLEGASVRDVEPGLTDKVLGALHAPLDGVADHEATTRAYAAAATRAGAVIRTGATVVDVVRDGARVTGVTLAGGEHIGVDRALLLLTNGGTADLLARASGGALPIWTIYPQVVISTPAATPPFHSYVGHLHRPVALKMVPGNRVMLSGGWRGRRNDATGRGETIPASVTGNWADAIAVFPAIADLAIAEATADRAETNALDAVPLIDRVPGLANAIVGCGWTGHGWAIAPAVAPLLAQWALEGGTPDLLRPFALSRFPALRA